MKLLKHNVSTKCDLCKHSYHADCIGLSKVDIKNLEFEKWSCLACNENLFSFNNSEGEEFINTICNTVLDLNLLDHMLFSPF